MPQRTPDSISIKLPDGQGLDATNETPGPAERGELQLVEVLRPRRFNACPICGDPAATEREHVPSGSLGGKVMISEELPADVALEVAHDLTTAPVKWRISESSTTDGEN